VFKEVHNGHNTSIWGIPVNWTNSSLGEISEIVSDFRATIRGGLVCGGFGGVVSIFADMKMAVVGEDFYWGKMVVLLSILPYSVFFFATSYFVEVITLILLCTWTS
jgi:hypothetical protein